MHRGRNADRQMVYDIRCSLHPFPARKLFQPAPSAGPLADGTGRNEGYVTASTVWLLGPRFVMVPRFLSNAATSADNQPGGTTSLLRMTTYSPRIEIISSLRSS